MTPPKVAISIEFLKAYSKIQSKSDQKEIRDFVDRFIQHPEAPGRNYETVQGARDPNIKSVRVDQDYRAIILRAQAGRANILLWIDHHDDAYRWAKRKKCIINARTGSIQIVRTPIEVEPATKVKGEVQPSVPTGRGLFSDLDDKALTGIGVPNIIIDQVRSITTESELADAEETLPADIFERLIDLYTGSSLEEILSRMTCPPEGQEVDVEDFETALEHPDTKRSMVVWRSDIPPEQIVEELELWAIISQPSSGRLVRGTRVAQSDYDLALELQKKMPHTYNALQGLVMAIEKYHKRRFKTTWFGRDRGVKAFKKLQRKLADTLIALEMDGVTKRSNPSDDIRRKLVMSIGTFLSVYPNWPRARAYTEEFFLGDPSGAEALIRSVLGG